MGTLKGSLIGLLDLSPIVAQPRRLSDHVYKTLCDAIVDGKLSPGQRLTEAQVAEVLGVSRTPVRAALARLIQQRLLQTDVSSACFVAEWDRQTLREIATLRASLEGLAFGLAPHNLSQEDFDHLERIIRQMDEVEAEPGQAKQDRLAVLDFQFHSCIWSRAGHKLLEQALENIEPQTRYFMHLTGQASVTHYGEEHRKLLALLRRDDRSKSHETLMKHILPNIEMSIAWWERTHEEAAEKQENAR